MSTTIDVVRTAVFNVMNTTNPRSLEVDYVSAKTGLVPDQVREIFKWFEVEGRGTYVLGRNGRRSRFVPVSNTTVTTPRRRTIKRTTQAVARNASDVVTVPQAAKILRMPESTAYRLFTENRIPGAFKVDNVVRVNRTTLTNWIRQG